MAPFTLFFFSDFSCDLLEVAEDCGEYGTDKYALVAERGYILSLIVFGSRDTNTLKWKSKLKQDKLQQWSSSCILNAIVAVNLVLGTMEHWISNALTQ